MQQYIREKTKFGTCPFLAYRFRYVMLEKENALEDKLTAEQENSEQLQEINIASNKFVPHTFLNFLGKQNILEASLCDFDNGFSLYSSKKFAKAVAGFEAVFVKPSDLAAQRFKDKAIYYLTYSVGDEWTVAEVMEKK